MAEKTDSEYQAEGGKDRGERKRTASGASSSTAEASAQKKVVLVGGWTSFITRTDQITYLNEQHQNIPITIAEEHNYLEYYAVSFHGNNITISGGVSMLKDESVDTINQYDTIKRQWRKLPNLQQKTSLHVSLIIHHLLYIIAGGFMKSGSIQKYYKDVAILDLLTGKWRQGAEIPHAVTWAGAAVVNGNIVVAGGRDTDGEHTAKTVKYDPEANRWSDCTSLPKSRDFAFNSTVAVGNLMYLLANNDFFEYDITCHQWTILTAPPVPSINPAMLVHDDHTLLVVGGREGLLHDSHGRIQRYDLRTRQ
jgi:hypothetical protein